MATFRGRSVTVVPMKAVVTFNSLLYMAIPY